MSVIPEDQDGEDATVLQSAADLAATNSDVKLKHANSNEPEGKQDDLQ